MTNDKATQRKIYSRYIYNRGLQTLWKGDAANPGALYRTIAITSDEFNSTLGVFQVLELEGTGKGIENGKFAGTEGDPKVLFDSDFNGMDAAAEQFKKLVKEAEAAGLKLMTFWDQIEYEEKLRAPKK
jgi:hypothetical protein